ncbi:dimethylargininase [Saccharopolyspora phatthalungensis]|uniref:N-dimethylarginine dimethylaminohydrolase n=1 Tax=Saccharopolyspora phatthalungensis TaxID=664693 RepID=A0A840Q8E4_9PSEU|nr:dimethylargininase [Saccharopolyspora phatthalungensis]MBB5154695.1 N-dimethylarginine dimethylaminohydrolase [Saccharopolyspora phatthalungensis]
MTVTAGQAVATLASPHATTRRYVMCAPKYFTVEYSINPWMDPGAPVDVDLAMLQWAELRRTYERLGHLVEVVEPQPGLPDMVFAANSATVIDGRVLGARFRAPQRAAEAEHFRRWFITRGYRNVVMPSRINEAEGDFAWTGRVLLAGSGFRTDPEAHAEAQEALGVPVVSLRLVDPRYYHLDTALFVLECGERAQIAYFPGAFSSGSRRVLERMFPDAVIADAADAACLGLNGVSDGRHVVLPAEATGLAAQLAARGYEPILLGISELRKSGGGPKCCTLELHA